MDPRLHQIISLLMELHEASAALGARRMAVVEKLVPRLAEILRADAALLLRRAPTDLSGWYVRWAGSFQALPTDGIVRCGLLYPEGPRIVAEPQGWDADRESVDLPSDDAVGRPIMGMGITAGREVMRLILIRESGKPLFDEVEADLFAGTFEHIGLHVRMSERMERMRREAVTDELTRIFNYRYLKRTLADALRRVRQKGGLLSVLMIDVDNLRKYNDRYGHLEASKVLADMGRVLERSLRTAGWVAKYGGDEFVIVLPDTGKAEAMALADRLRRDVELARVGGEEFGGITCCFGVATAPLDGVTFVDLLESADHAVFKAKAQGRNTVVAAPAENVRHSRDEAA